MAGCGGCASPPVADPARPVILGTAEGPTVKGRVTINMDGLRAGNVAYFRGSDLDVYIARKLVVLVD